MKAENKFKLRVSKKKLLDKIENQTPASETKMNRSKRANRFGWFGKGFLIAVFSLLLLFLIFNINYLTPSKMKEHMKAVFADFGHGEGFPYHFSSDDIIDFFAFSSGDKVILTNNDLIILNGSANEVLHYKHSMSNPIAKPSRDRILLFDQGSTKAIILNQSGQVLSFPNENKILCADISDSGKSVIVTRDDSQKEVLSVYNFSGKKMMEWEKGEGYIIDCTISANGNFVALGIVDTENAMQTVNVFTFSVSNAKQKGHMQFKSSYLYDLDFLTTNDLAVLCNNKISVLNAKCELKSDLELSADSKQLFTDKKGHIINVYSLYNNGNYTIDVYNTSLKKIYSKDSEGEIVKVSSDGSSLATLFTNKTAQVNKIGGNVTFTCKLDIDPMFILSNNKTVFVCSNGTVEKVKATRK